jgi:hypothetical protein
MKKTAAVLAVAMTVPLYISGQALAEEQEPDVSINNTISDESTPTTEEGVDDSQTPSEENVDTLPPPSEEMIEEDPWFEASTDPDGDGPEVPTSQEQEQTWAVVDENGNTVNIISCTQSYCGSGWIPTEFDGHTPTEFARVVLQSDYNPETNSNNGGHWGQHNFSSGQWTLNSGSGTMVMPTDPNEVPYCIADCVAPPEEVVSDPDSVSDSPDIITQELNSAEEQASPEIYIAKSGDYRVILNSNETDNKIKIRFNKKSSSVNIIAKKWYAPGMAEKKVWKIKFKNKKIHVFSVPEKYSGWKFFIKNKGSKIKRVNVL